MYERSDKPVIQNTIGVLCIVELLISVGLLNRDLIVVCFHAFSLCLNDGLF